MSKQIDRTKIKTVLSGVEIARDLTQDRLFLTLSMAISMVSVVFLLYTALVKDSLDIVYLNNTYIDGPTLLEKVKDSRDSVKADRYIRGFSRRVLTYFFTQPDDSNEMAKKALSWLHAHSSTKGQARSESLMSDIDSYNAERKQKYSQFYPSNAMESVKIRQSKLASGEYTVEIPGTLLTVDANGKAYLQARLRLNISSSNVSGLPTSLGDVNAFGLIITSMEVEFRKDLSRPDDVTTERLL